MITYHECKPALNQGDKGNQEPPHKTHAHNKKGKIKKEETKNKNKK